MEEEDNENGNPEKSSDTRYPQRIVTWLIYGLVFKMLIDKKPFKAALFDRDSIVFLVIVTIVEIILYYVTQARKAGK